MARSQIENRNFLAPTGFQFNLKRSPKVAFFCNEANIPDLNLGVAVQPNYLRDIPTPGDKIEFGDLSLRFLVDENLENYLELQDWIRGLGYPESVQEFRDLAADGIVKGPYVKDRQNIYSDGTLQILSSNLVPKFNVNFRDLFPTSLTTLTFDATDTDIQYFTANAEFKYTSYEIVPIGTAPVIPYIPAPTISLTASSTSNVPNNTDVTFTWETTNASQVSINNGVGIVTSPNGRLDVTVNFGDETSRTYTATAIGSGGEQSADITIERTQAATADFFLATYTFTDGRDLDIRASVVSPTGYGVTVGYGLSNSIPGAGVTWGGDNLGTGVESILFTKSEFVANNAGINTVSFDLRAGWYQGGDVGFQPVVVNVTSFVGGAMVYDSSNKTWTNPTATETFTGFTSTSKQITERIGDQPASTDMGERIAIMNLDFVEGTVSYT
jgi:hypothetical protein